MLHVKNKMKTIQINAAALIALFLLIAAASAQNVKENPPEKNITHTETKSDEHKKIALPVIPVTIKDARTTPYEKVTRQCTCQPDSKGKDGYFRRLWQEPNAFFTAILAFITLVLVVVTFRQVRLFRIELILGKRPQLRVRNVVVKQPRPIHAVQPEIFEKGTLVSGQFYIDNVGGTDAYITESGCWVVWTQDLLPMERPYEGENGNKFKKKLRLRPGESLPLPFVSDKTMGEEGRDILHGTGNWHLYVMGWVEYTDDLNIHRRIEYCREYRMPEGRFIAVNNTDYEHEN